MTPTGIALWSGRAPRREASQTQRVCRRPRRHSSRHPWCGAGGAGGHASVQFITLGFGRIVASEIEAPFFFKANLV
jgi:hypothetical protein